MIAAARDRRLLGGSVGRERQPYIFPAEGGGVNGSFAEFVTRDRTALRPACILSTARPPNALCADDRPPYHRTAAARSPCFPAPALLPLWSLRRNQQAGGLPIRRPESLSPGSAVQSEGIRLLISLPLATQTCQKVKKGASSAESVGLIWLRKLSELVIQGDFNRFI